MNSLFNKSNISVYQWTVNNAENNNISRTSVAIDGTTSGTFTLKAAAETDDITIFTPATLPVTNGSFVRGNTNGILSWTAPEDVVVDTNEVKVNGATSGTFTLQAADTTTTHTMKAPPTIGVADQLLSTDGAGNSSWKTLVSDAVVAGVDTEIQFNDAGDLGADSNFTFNKITGKLGLGRGAYQFDGVDILKQNVVKGNLQVGSSAVAVIPDGAENNTFIGANAAAAGTIIAGANNNTGFGKSIFNRLTSGSRNSTMGMETAAMLTSGRDCTLAGYRAGVSNGAIVNATAIGVNTTVSNSNTVMLGNNQVRAIVNGGLGGGSAAVNDSRFIVNTQHVYSPSIYGIGTVSQDGNTVTGASGATFTADMVNNGYIEFDNGEIANITAFVNGTELTVEQAQVITSSVYKLYYTHPTNRASQAGFTVTGVGTAFTNVMAGHMITFDSGECARITVVTSTTLLTVNVSQTVASTGFRIYYGGTILSSDGQLTCQGILLNGHSGSLNNINSIGGNMFIGPVLNNSIFLQANGINRATISDAGIHVTNSPETKLTKNAVNVSTGGGDVILFTLTLLGNTRSYQVHFTSIVHDGTTAFDHNGYVRYNVDGAGVVTETYLFSAITTESVFSTNVTGLTVTFRIAQHADNVRTAGGVVTCLASTGNGAVIT